QADVNADAVEPGAEGGVAAKAGEGAQDPEERLLHRIFRVLRVSQEAVAEREERPLVQRQELVQGGAVTGLASREQRPLVRAAVFALIRAHDVVRTRPARRP